MTVTADWTGKGKVRARMEGAALEISVRGLTTQTRYYKVLLREFFRKEFTRISPRYGDFHVHIRMEYEGDPPWMDLDNLAKALLDSVTGAAFHDDSQVSRLLVERVQVDQEGIWMRVEAAGQRGS
jgi:crossover junction endodeoxyribonuclease RusA